MSKVNVNRATREELIEVAGLRPAVADAVLKARHEHGGRLSGTDALKDVLREVKGVGTATLDQLGQALDFDAEAVKGPAEKAVDLVITAAQAGTDGAKRAAEATAEIASIAIHSGGDAAAKAAGDVTRTEAAVGNRSLKATVELGEIVAALVGEQLQQNLATMQALAQARTPRQALEIQSEFVRRTMARATDGGTRYAEAVGRLATSLFSLGRAAARKAA